jgi:signal transduction histidine kinase
MEVSDSGLRKLALASAVLMVMGTTAGVLMALAADRLDTMAFQVLMAPFPIVGFLVILRRPRNTLGWLMFSMGFAIALPFEPYARYALAVRGGALPGGPLALALAGPSWIPFFAIAGFLLLLFPDGHLPSPRWRWFARTCGIGLTLCATCILLFPSTGKDYGFPRIHNPLGVEALKPILGFAIVLAALAPILMLGGAVGIVLRLRRTTDDIERHQLRLLGFTASLVAVLYALAFVGNAAWSSWLQIVGVSSLMLIPIAIGIAILKYRLYDIDIVINKTIVFGALAAFITVFYVAIVVGVGSVLGSRSNTALSILATAVVALAFQPVRSRVQKLANRLVYGQRATPYETLTRLSERAGTTYSIDDVLPNAARVIGEGLGAHRTEVWLLVDDRLRCEATWPDPEAETTDAPGGNLVLPVELHGEQVGAIAVTKKRGEQLTPQEEDLLRDVAGQAGLMMSNVRLTADLEARLDKIAAQAAELRASRQRIVAAQDEERRQLERNIHDGAQQHLVALAVKLRLARAMLAKDPGKATAMLQELRAQIDAALDTLNQLSLGIYPPLLESEGLAAALRAQFSQPDIRLELIDEGLCRQPIELEAAAYFCSLEALQNVAKYSGATTVAVRLEQSEDELTFTVEDDGRGFDTGATSEGTGLVGMRDRLAVFGGTIDLESVPGRGTRVRGTIPVAAVVS